MPNHSSVGRLKRPLVARLDASGSAAEALAFAEVLNQFLSAAFLRLAYLALTNWLFELGEVEDRRVGKLLLCQISCELRLGANLDLIHGHGN